MPGASRVRVLIVDDHDLVAQSLVRLLGDDPSLDVIGYEYSAQAGIDRAILERPDVVIMDYVMPNMNGAVATRLLKQDLPDVAVIMLTGSDRPGAYSAAMEAGSAAWVRKSRAASDLLSVVHLAASGQRIITTAYENELPPLNELLVYYQPIVQLTDHALVGFEALVRWRHPTEGLLLPGRFLPLAEETGYIVDVGRHVTRQALGDLAQWQRASARADSLFVSINMSATGVANPGMAPEFVEMIELAGVPPRRVVMELTETALLGDDPAIDANVQRLKEAGVRLALDDFGTAFSSLSYLRRFPFDVVKIDTSFTAELPDDPRAVLLVETIEHMATTMSAMGIAEGIERESQEHALRQAGWPWGQGFLYSRPVPFDRALEMVERGLEG